MPRYTPPRNLLAGRAILVTGAAEGLGRAAALAYATHGAEVIALDANTPKLESLYDAIVQAGGCEPALHRLDLARAGTSEYDALAHALSTQVGHLDGILHNAAALELLTPLGFHAPEVWERTLRVNLTAPFLLTQACLPLLSEAPDPVVIFTSDECAVRPKGYWGAYGVSKAGIEALAATWGQELSNTPVRMHILDPGPARTEMRLRTHPGAPMASWPEPAALMPAYLYLMGPEGRAAGSERVSAQAWITPPQDAGPRGLNGRDTGAACNDSKTGAL